MERHKTVSIRKTNYLFWNTKSELDTKAGKRKAECRFRNPENETRIQDFEIQGSQYRIRITKSKL